MNDTTSNPRYAARTGDHRPIETNQRDRRRQPFRSRGQYARPVERVVKRATERKEPVRTA